MHFLKTDDLSIVLCLFEKRLRKIIFIFHTLSHFLTALLHTTISLLYLLYVVFFASVHFHHQSVQVMYHYMQFEIHVT